jgi:ectoine hydroxylase-related dioxygenase (phytanoyl-CoA dioxygenase family)
MQPLFKDPAVEAQFERDGYVVTDLFSPGQVRRLMALYRRRIPDEAVSGLYESSRHNSYEINRSINEAIRELVTLAGREVFLPAKIYGGSFMVKSHVDSEVLPLHQDWSVVEEDKYRTLFLWCPLLDVSARNGCLFVLPGSQRFFGSLRSGSYPSDRFVLPIELHRQTRDVPLSAGQAVLYSDQLFHGSYANNGPTDRIVVTARVMESEADLVYFHKVNDHEVDIHRADEQFYLTHIDSLAKGGLPAGVHKLYRRPYSHVPVTDATLQAKIREHFPASTERPAMKRLFRDGDLQTEFEANGYVVIDLIGWQQIDELMAFYSGLPHAATPAGGFQVSLDNENPDFVCRVSERLVTTVRDSVDRHFEQHKIFTASFVTKAKDPMGVVPPHQDWTFVDEGEYWSATIWCPLVDVTMQNGALGVIKGSHRLYDHVRPSPSPQYAPPFAHQLAAIFPYVKLMPLKAGQALVFDNRTIHASPPNQTGHTRVAFGIGVTHKDAKIRHYYLLPGEQPPRMEGYEVEPGFFHYYNNARLATLHESGQKPRDAASIGVFAVSAKEYDTNQLVRAIEAAGNHADPALMPTAAALFGQTSFAAGLGGARHVAHDPSRQPAAPALPLWKVYTPGNIVREIRYRLTGR